MTPPSISIPTTPSRPDPSIPLSPTRTRTPTILPGMPRLSFMSSSPSVASHHHHHMSSIKRAVNTVIAAQSIQHVQPTIFENGIIETRAANSNSARPPPTILKRTSSLPSHPQFPLASSSPSTPELASSLATSLVLSLRSYQLLEASDLHSSLHFHKSSLESSPLLSYLESFPFTLDSPHITSLRIKDVPSHITNLRSKITSLQAVITRRLHSLGVLQSHILRAGWSKGVTGWGVLGVTNQYNRQGNRNQFNNLLVSNDATDSYFDPSDAADAPEPPTSSSSPLFSRVFNRVLHFIRTLTRLLVTPSLLSYTNTPGNGLWHALLSGNDNLDHAPALAADHRRLLSASAQKQSHISVPINCKEKPDVLIDKAALTRWSIDAIRLVRHQLNRAGGGVLPALCYGENWGEGTDVDGGVWDLDELNSSVPSWATERDGEYIITDVLALCQEVDGLVDCIDEYMQTQRERRLEVLRPPSLLKRSWYLIAISVPMVGVGVYQYWNNRKHFAVMVEKAIGKMMIFYTEHVKEPVEYIIDEFFTSKVRTSITDEVALNDTRNSLKRMLYSWLKDSYPDMTEEDVLRRSNAMDVSLIEEQFEGNVSTNAVRSVMTGDIIRMALIQVQFLKKEMLVAMDSMDDIMESNEINFRLSSMMPAFMVVYVMRATFKMLYYNLMPTGRKSKEETFATIRSLLLDIERLLVMRDDPPPAPDQLVYSSDPALGLSFDDMGGTGTASPVQQSQERRHVPRKTLDENDWGMVMLLIHQIQSTLAKESQRFGGADIANILEDLAEVAGERGPVSIKQQRSIVERMARTYSFLKVLAGFSSTLTK